MLYSAAIHIFSEKNGIAQGGITGAAMLINHIFPFLPIGTVALLMNLPLFLIAWKKIGGKFIVKSFLVTVFLSVSIDAFSFLPSYTGDKLLAAVFCGGISGLSMALIFMRGLTSGGTDIIAKLIRLKKPQFSMGKLILAADFAVVISAGLVYGNFESAMYSLILIFVSSFVIDKILFGLTDSRTLLIVTQNAQKSALLLMCEIGRGVSVISIEGGYTGESKKLLLCAMRRGEVNRVVKLISEIDKTAFTIVLPSSEIIGEGFHGR